MNKPSFESGYAQLGPLKMYYEIHGKGGTPLVLLRTGRSREHAVKMSGIIPNAQLVIVPGTHGSYLGESGSGDGKMQAITVGLVKEFLDK